MSFGLIFSTPRPSLLDRGPSPAPDASPEESSGRASPIGFGLGVGYDIPSPLQCASPAAYERRPRPGAASMSPAAVQEQLQRSRSMNKFSFQFDAKDMVADLMGDVDTPSGAGGAVSTTS